MVRRNESRKLAVYQGDREKEEKEVYKKVTRKNEKKELAVQGDWDKEFKYEEERAT